MFMNNVTLAQETLWREWLECERNEPDLGFRVSPQEYLWNHDF